LPYQDAGPASWAVAADERVGTGLAAAAERPVMRTIRGSGGGAEEVVTARVVV